MKKKGAGLIEVIIGSSIITLSLLGLLATLQLSLAINTENGKRIQAQFLFEEGVEAVRMIRDISWDDFSSLPLDTSLFVYFDEEQSRYVSTSTHAVLLDEHERTFFIRDVYRDEDGKISETGTLDDGMRKVDMEVSWMGRNGTTTYSGEMYVGDIFE